MIRVNLGRQGKKKRRMMDFSKGRFRLIGEEKKEVCRKKLFFLENI